MNANDWNLLSNRKIIDILIGDTRLGTFDEIELRMPYLKGSALCTLSTTFGLPRTYSWGGSSQSRWSYLDDLILFLVKEGQVSDLLKELFKKNNFEKELTVFRTKEKIKEAFEKIQKLAIEEINTILLFADKELVYINDKFYIKSCNENFAIKVPSFKKVDRAYINEISDRALKDIKQNAFDSALTKSRTLLEEVFIYVLELKGINPSDKGDIKILYNQVKDLYNMHGNKDIDKRINMLLSGLEKIVSAISDMRNKSSDSHGLGEKRIRISDYHARLFVNSAQIMSDFILSVAMK